MSTSAQLRAVIIGISGQDGAYLARLLLSRGYVLDGTSRNAVASGFPNLDALKVSGQVRLSTLNLLDAVAVSQYLEAGNYDEVYHLAAESSVGQSFLQPREVILESQAAAANVLEAARHLRSRARFFFAGSGECFGDPLDQVVDEMTPFRPKSPYAVAKSAAHWQVAMYRDAYGLHCSTGILFNHESPLRSDRFVTGKMVAAALRIASGSGETLELGDISVERDWGWAPEYVEAMWRMLQQTTPSDYVIATGNTCSLQEMVDAAFSAVGLDWTDHVSRTATLHRPQDIRTLRANPAKAMRLLNWRPTVSGTEVAHRMVVERAELIGQGLS